MDNPLKSIETDHQKGPIKGSLSVGKRADLVVLSANPVRVEAEQITAIRVRRTVCGGIIIYSETDGRYA